MELTMAGMHSRERVLTGAALAIITLLAWYFLMSMGAHSKMDMPAPGGWELDTLLMSVLMWSLMMLAMMLPSASPMILTYSKVYRHRVAARQAALPTWTFTLGYLLVWMGFALMAALLQWGLHGSALLSSAMGQVGSLLGAGLLILAGLFQFSGLKQACLGRCRSPFSFLMTKWREGVVGTVVMGLRHGAFCTGCCWALMLLMFAGGVMNLAWMAALALYFLLEKVLPYPSWISRITGVLLIAAGIAVPWIQVA